MRTKIYKYLIVGIVWILSVSFNNKNKDFILINLNNQGQDLSKEGSIENPLKLDYEFNKISKSEDGTSVNLFVEKGRKNYIGGDYVWTKSVPFYASSEFKYVFEYQMNCSDHDLTALIKWLQENIGENVKGGSIDRPKWYYHEMTLSEVFNYCNKNKQNITMGYYNESLKREAIVVIDTGSETTKTSAEIGLVYIIYR
jgi:hypothetical protein